MEKRNRRSFSKEYKAEVVALVRKGGKSIGLRRWRRREVGCSGS